MRERLSMAVFVAPRREGCLGAYANFAPSRRGLGHRFDPLKYVIVFPNRCSKSGNDPEYYSISEANS